MAALLWDIQGDENQQTKEPEELSVFGYACKLFREDNKASSIDQGEHLIPWMGDTSLMIDRYDGRGHLFDLSTYDASRVKAIQLSDDEQHLETLCDEERYLELKHDMAEKKMYEEEEWKRYYQSLSEGFNAVGFSYDHQHQQDYMETAAAALEQEPVFEVPEELQVPVDVAVPETEKHHAIIEKTAKFIAAHGMQMEIIIKTKQAKNPQFEFLHFEDPLNHYYKHMVSMIKSGKYKPKEPKEEEDQDDCNDDEPHSQHGYLHPSLVKPKILNPALNIAPAVKMPAVAIHDTPYGKLISKFKKSVPEAERNSNSPQPPHDSGSYSPHSQSNTPPPQDTSLVQTVDYHHGAPGVPPPPGLEPVTLPVSNQPPPPGTEPVGPLLPPHLQQQVLQQEEIIEEKPPSVQHTQLIGPSLEPKIIPPPPDIQPIIDRMAMYVAKNGVEFEIVVRSKNDPRFEFLQPWHSYFRYYNSKKKIFIEEVLKEREKLEQEKPAKLSFSIKNKTKDQDGVVTSEKKKKKLFDHDSSGEDDSEGIRDRLMKSGTSTPVDGELSRTSSDDRLPEISEKKLAEEKLKNRLAQAARDKMSKASREKQIQAERKRKAAMFINMLKSAKGSNDKDDSKSNSTPSGSRSHTPLPFDEEPEAKKVKKSSSKYSRSRSRSPRRTKSRKSRSRSKSPKRRKSPSPPSAYNKRSESRSPSRLKSSRRSKSPTNKRSFSPSLRRSDSPAKSSKKSKKKKRSRTKSRSPTRSDKPIMIYDESPEELDSIRERLSASPITTSNVTSRISQPVADEDSNSAISTDGSKNVSNYMLSRVRALIKASREAVKKEDMFDDS